MAVRHILRSIGVGDGWLQAAEFVETGPRGSGAHRQGAGVCQGRGGIDQCQRQQQEQGEVLSAHVARGQPGDGHDGEAGSHLGEGTSGGSATHRDA